VIIVADRGLLSMDNVAELARIADDSARKLQFILAVPARRYAELGETLEGLSYTDGLAEGRFADHRLVVAHDPVRAAEQARSGVSASRDRRTGREARRQARRTR
jgi:hypothetical protein